LKTLDDGPLKGFAIAGEDHKFVWADARIERDTVIVSSPKISKPVAVRYGWADNPIVNLYNKAGLPASPFRTDDWPGITAARR
jgi:sialate O-acetylesterase